MLTIINSLFFSKFAGSKFAQYKLIVVGSSLSVFGPTTRSACATGQRSRRVYVGINICVPLPGSPIRARKNSPTCLTCLCCRLSLKSQSWSWVLLCKHGLGPGSILDLGSCLLCHHSSSSKTGWGQQGLICSTY